MYLRPTTRQVLSKHPLTRHGYISSRTFMLIGPPGHDQDEEQFWVFWTHSRKKAAAGCLNRFSDMTCTQRTRQMTHETLSLTYKNLKVRRQSVSRGANFQQRSHEVSAMNNLYLQQLRARLWELLKEYDEATSGPSDNDPDLIKRVRRYFSERKARRDKLSIIKGRGGPK